MSRENEVQPSIQAEELPEIIQGGMGFGVSNYELAGAVARNHELGVVSGTGTGMLLARRLQDGHLESVEALEAFPDEDLAAKIIERYFIEGGTEPRTMYPKPDMLTLEEVERIEEQDKATISYQIGRDAEELNLVGAFVEVALARKLSKGNGYVGLNILRKLEEPYITTMFGAMLADVDVVIIGAGIPLEAPKILDNLAQQLPVTMSFDVKGAKNHHQMVFNPETRYPKLKEQALSRPVLLPIISSNPLADALVRRSEPPPNGFVVELHRAGGHNASPRGKVTYNETGEPIYGARDEIDYEKLSRHGLPFWIAGEYGSPEKLVEAKALGAKGIQAGSVFALTRESGMDDFTKRKIVKDILDGNDIEVYTDPLASPTGYPFKVAQIGGSLSESDIYTKKRVRVCDLGYLREKYEVDDGSIGHRCPSEPVRQYVKKGGEEAHTEGRKCLCNALSATINMPQYRGEKRGYEQPIFTLGNDVNRVVRLMMDKMGEVNPDTGDPELYIAKGVIEYLKSGQE